MALHEPDGGAPLQIKVAYVHSSQEGREVAAARERALVKAEEALRRVANGLGGRDYKTRKDVDKRVAQVVGRKLEGLLIVKTATRNARPTLSFRRDEQAIERAAATDGIYALATNLPGRLSPGRRGGPSVR